MGTGDELDPLAVTMLGGGEAAEPLAAGTWIGRYLITGVLGHGGMGVVYGAHDPDLDRPVAIKLLRPELRAAGARLLREGQAVAKLHHPNVVIVHDVGEHGDDLFIAMELVRGTTLGAWMREGAGRRRPWREVLARLIPAGRGLAAAHAAGLVHRDFKPENVLLGDRGRVVVTDFGLAQLPDEPSLSVHHEARIDLTRTGAMLGTPAYMSPEQFRGERSDARSDQFSFCITLYEALTGTRPFDPRDGSVPSVSDLQSAVERGRIAPIPGDVAAPRWLRRAIARGLDPDPAKRFATIEELLVALAPPRRALWIGLGLGAAAAAIASFALWPRQESRLVAFDPASCDAAATIDVPAGGWRADDAARWRTVRWAACAGGADARVVSCLDDHRAALLAPPGDYWPALPALGDCFAPAATPTWFPAVISLGPQGVAQLSPDGMRIAVSDLDGDAVVLAADPKAYAPAPIAGARVIGDWLADGTLLVQHRDRSQALRAPDGSESPLPGPGDLLFTQINTISPDHTRLANQEDGAVVIRAVPGGEVIARHDGLAHELAWEPDGHRLAIISRDLSTLTLWDARAHTTATIAVGLHARGLGEIGMAWLAPGRLLLSGSADTQGIFGLWELDLDDASQLTRAPALRWTAPPGRLLRLFDVQDGRVLAETQLSRQRILLWHAGVATELPASLNDVKLTGFDDATGIGLGAGTQEVVTFGLDGRARTASAGPTFTTPTLRDGQPSELRRLSPGQYVLHDLDGSGEMSISWDERHGTPVLRCSPHAPDRCVVWSHVGAVATFARLGDPATTTLAGVTSNTIDISAGGHVLVGTDAGDIVDLDLAGGHATVGHVDAPDCVIRHARFGPDGVWVGLLCPERFVIGRLRAAPGAGFEPLIPSGGWISGMEALPDGDVLFSRMDWDPQLVIVDGLDRR